MSRPQDDAITVVVTRRVRPGCEAAFESALKEFVQRSSRGDGQLGVSIVRPAPGGGSSDYGIMRRFSNGAARDSFYASELFRDWERMVAPLSEGVTRREDISGMEAWFTAPGTPMPPPPRWKMAVVTLLAVYPMSLLMPVLLGPLVDGWPRWASGLVVAAGIVASLTWVIMPRLAWVLHRWLYGK